MLVFHVAGGWPLQHTKIQLQHISSYTHGNFLILPHTCCGREIACGEFQVDGVGANPRSRISCAPWRPVANSVRFQSLVVWADGLWQCPTYFGIRWGVDEHILWNGAFLHRYPHLLSLPMPRFFEGRHHSPPSLCQKGSDVNPLVKLFFSTPKFQYICYYRNQLGFLHPLNSENYSSLSHTKKISRRK